MSGPEEVLRAPWPQTEAAALRDALYARAFARDLSQTSTATETLLGPELVRLLSAANRSRDRWSEGWRIERVEPSGAIVAVRDASRRTAEPGEYTLTLTDSLPPRAGMAATLLFRRESLTMQSEVYYAFGETPPDAEPDAIRFYFAAPEANLAGLYSHLTGTLNGRQIPFILKTMLAPHERTRSDSTVLYVSRRNAAEVRSLLTQLPEELLRSLNPRAPLFTLPIASGVGMAESPSTGESFGMHRCRLLAEAILEARREGREDAAYRMRMVERRFREAGIDPDRPHLSGVERPAIVDWLLRRGLAGDAGTRWEIRHHDSRNFNCAVLREDGSGYFVKRLRVPGAESLRMMEREAAVYPLVAAAGLAPAFHLFDRDERTLVLDFFPHTERTVLAADFARAAALTLGKLHRVDGVSRTDVSGIFDRRPPGILTAHRGGPLLQWLGPGQLRLIDRVREDRTLARALDRMAADWRCRVPIHGDVKWENCLWNAERREMKWIDWELADLGDPAWDAGCFVQAYLSHHVRTGADLNAMRPALRAFFAEYSEAAPEAIVRCAAARMIQMALEVMHGRLEPTPEALRLLRAATEMLERPRETLDLLPAHDNVQT